MRSTPVALLAAAFGFVVITTGEAAATSKLSRISRDASEIEAASGSVRIIVRLDMPAGRTRAAASSDEDEARAIAAVIDGFEARVFGRRAAQRGGKAEPRRIRRARNIPVVALDATPAEIERVAADPAVAQVSIDRHMDMAALNDTVPLIGASALTASGYDGTNQIVAVLDTGIDLSHPWLQGRLIDGACFSRSDAENVSLCPNGASVQFGIGAPARCTFSAFENLCAHGTVVTGVVTGRNPSPAFGEPLYGTARGAMLLPIQTWSYNVATKSLGSWTSDTILALDHIYSRRNAYPGKSIAAVSISYGGRTASGACPDEGMRPAIQKLRSVGIAVVAAAGNGGRNNAIISPACVPEVVSVAASTKDDRPAGYADISSQTTFFAPGDAAILHAGGGYTTASGSSLSAPHVAAVIAMLKQARPGASLDAIIAALRSTGQPMTKGPHTKPRIQADRALAALGGTVAVGKLSASPGAIVITKVDYYLSRTSFAVNISAAGAATSWRLTSLPTWLRAGTTSGIAGSTPSSADFRVVVPAGQKTTLKGSLTFAAVGSSQTISVPVTLEVVKATITVKPITSTTVQMVKGKPSQKVITLGITANAPKVAFEVVSYPKWLRPRRSLIDVATLKQLNYVFAVVSYAAKEVKKTRRGAIVVRQAGTKRKFRIPVTLVIKR